MKLLRNGYFTGLLLLFLCSAASASEDHKLVADFAARLDSVERNFWRVAVLAEDHRMRPKFSAQLSELESLARMLRVRCVSMKCKTPVPDLFGDAVTLHRTFDQFRVDSKVKNRNIKLTGTGTREYQRRHNKLMRDKAKEEAEESGKKGKKRSYKLRPKLYQIDSNDYSEFLDDIADKNSRKFSSWTNRLNSREKMKTAEQLFSVWQKTICDMRMKLVELAQKGIFKEEKKNVGTYYRR